MLYEVITVLIGEHPLVDAVVVALVDARLLRAVVDVHLVEERLRADLLGVSYNFV